MKTLTTDVAIIGAGTAGLGAYRAAKAHGKQVLLIEGGPYGTTCARVGCMPSKLLIAAAEAAHSAQHTQAFGVNVEGKVTIDGRAVMQRVRDERDRFAGFVVETVENFPEEDKLRGFATFLSPNELQIDDHTKVVAERIVIATGSSPAYPKAFEQFGSRLVINDDIFSWDTLPESVAVFGPGVIGLELGQALHRLGVNVKVFGVGSAVGPLSDDVVREYAKKALSEEFYLDPDSQVTHMSEQDEKAIIRFVHKETQEEVEEQFDYVLAATGRRPNVAGLALENAGIDLDERGLPNFDPFTMQCGESHIFIAGDANNLLPLLHEAADQGKIAGDNAGRFPDIRSGLRRTPISVVFSDPQIAMVGETQRQLDARYGKCGCFAVGEVSFEDQGRSRVMLKNKGILHVYGEQGTGLFLGAEMIGPAAEHIAHLLSWAVQSKMTVSQMLDMPFYHPVIEEGVRTALRDLNSKLHLGPKIIQHCIECGPGA